VAGERFRHSSGTFEQRVRSGPGLMLDAHQTVDAMLTVTTVIVVSSEPMFARGGGAANVMNSPGYQRRLQESRQQVSQPDAQPSATHRRKWRHRRQH
jgi:hypothetical protein